MPELIFDLHAGVGTIRLNRPEQLNAFTPQMVDLWTQALDTCRRDDACRVVVVTGEGRAFCSGGDVKSLEYRGHETALDRKTWLWEHVQRIPLAVAALDKPVISGINGLAVGAGLDLALMSDLRYAADDARFAESYIRMALVPGAGGAWLLPRLVGLSRALEMLWLGDWVDAAQAERLGLVNRVLPRDALMPHVMEVAQRLADGPGVAIRMVKRMAVSAAGMGLAEHLDLASSHMGVVSTTADHREAVAARAEKRAPVFHGR
jgi:2-(1,2-epoxy-1,2-dihydrophenyl)acetyl-CoA isomerase